MFTEHGLRNSLSAQMPIRGFSHSLQMMAAERLGFAESALSFVVLTLQALCCFTDFPGHAKGDMVFAYFSSL